MQPPASLRHVAIVADGLAAAGPPAAAITAALESAAPIVAAVFAIAPGIEALTFFSPELRDWVLRGEPGAVRSCGAALPALAAAARRAGARFRLLGRTDRLPPELDAPTGGAAGVAAPLVGWFLDYGARDEILRAAARIPAGATLDEPGFAALLDTAGIPDPDLVLYAGGAFEPKDFLLWQASYAELWHFAAPWRDFAAEALREALADYSRRQRRFGA